MADPRGRPARLRVVTGDAKKHPERMNKDEPEPDGALGPPPGYMPKYQQKVWKEEAERCFWATAADRGAFEILVRNVAKARKLAKDMEKTPAVVKGSRGMVRHPKSYEQRECEDRAVKLYAEFGLSPTSRNRVKVPAKKKIDPAEKFMRKE